MTIDDVTKVNYLAIPGYEILLTSTIKAELKGSVIDLNKKFQSFVGPFLEDHGKSDCNSTVTKMQIKLLFYVVVIPLHTIYIFVPLSSLILS